jgi:hypothetical protein
MQLGGYSFNYLSDLNVIQGEYKVSVDLWKVGCRLERKSQWLKVHNWPRVQSWRGL